MQLEISEDEINQIHNELDLDEEGLTEDEILRRKTRIFVGGLKFASEDQVLYDFFARFGDIKEAVVIRDRKTGLSKGYGFVTMEDEMTSLQAIKNKSPKIDGRRCNVDLAYSGQKKKPQKKTEARFSDKQQQIHPQMCGYTSNGYIYSPTLVNPPGHYYLGLPPLHGHQPVYHFPQDPQPNTSQQVYDPRDVYPIHSSIQTIPQVYPQPVVLSPPIMLNPSNNFIDVFSFPDDDVNNNTCIQPSSSIMTFEQPIMMKGPSSSAVSPMPMVNSQVMYRNYPMASSYNNLTANQIFTF